MQHVVNKALTHAGNHKHGTAGHNPGRGRTPKAAGVQEFGKLIPTEEGVSTLTETGALPES